VTEKGAKQRNLDEAVVSGFGDEWTRFDQSAVPPEELRRAFEEYFAIFPWESLPEGSVGFDVGCGSGRWAKFVAPRVGVLHCIDASAAALDVARRSLAAFNNCEFHVGSVDALPLPDGGADFGYALGVLHHVPDTVAALRACGTKLRVGAPFLVYLYYRFDNRPVWYRILWRVSEVLRLSISRLPHPLRFLMSQILALTVYWPVARFARLVERLGFRASGLPLYYYSRRSFYAMRTDALDRFGTRLEQRYTRSEITKMFVECGFTDVSFSDRPPFWCAVARRGSSEQAQS
jgi:SAM-dependent methyltransferase